MTVPTDTFIGRSLGKYSVESKIGQGGMGMVYRGRQRSLNRAVAIKVLPAQMAMDIDFVQRFRQEAQLIAGLQHENIVHVYDIDHVEGAAGEPIYFIVMEFVDGFNLRQRPDRDRPMSWQRVRAVGLPLARALDYAHRRGIVHRDIKPANVMETRDGKIKLMDFGIAKSAGGVKTVMGSVLGTPEYMAPEQAQSGQVTPQSDIYSLGVLLYELATGRLPFQAGEPFAIALKHISEAPEPPSRHTPTLPSWLERVILRAMAKNPADRFADASAMAYALECADADPSSSASSMPTARSGPAVLPLDLAPTLFTPTPASAIDGSAPTLPTPISGMPASLTDSRRPVAWWPLAAVVSALALVAAAGISFLVLGSAHRGEAADAASTALAADAVGDNAAGDGAAGDGAVGDELDEAERLLAAGDLLGELSAAPSELEAEPAQDSAETDAGGAAARAAAARLEAERNEARRAAELAAARASAADAERRATVRQPEVRSAPPAAALNLRQLVQQARHHRSHDEYHSLRRVIHQIQASERPPRLDDDLQKWARKVDGWVRDREEDLEDEVSDLLDDFADAVEDKDMGDLADVWGDVLDAETAKYFRHFWDTYRKTEAKIQLRSVKPWDHEAGFHAVVRLYGKRQRGDEFQLVRTVDWHGRIRDQGGTRMIAPFPK